MWEKSISNSNRTLKIYQSPFFSINVCDNAYVFSDCTVVSADNKLLLSTVGGGNQTFFINHFKNVNDIKKIEKKVFIVGNIFINNQWHFIAETLASILLYCEFFLNTDVELFMIKPTNTVCLDYIELVERMFNVKLKIFEPAPDSLYRVDKCYFSSQLTNITSCHPTFFAYFDKLRKFVVENYKLSTQHLDKIYVNRRDASRRQIINEEELESFFYKLGYESITLSEFTAIERILIFNQCRELISTHAAGMSSLFFMPSGGKVVELFSKNCVWNFTPNLCYSKGLDYQGIVFDNVKNSNINSDFSVDLTLLSNSLLTNSSNFTCKINTKIDNLRAKDVFLAGVKGWFTMPFVDMETCNKIFENNIYCEEFSKYIELYLHFHFDFDLFIKYCFYLVQNKQKVDICRFYHKKININNPETFYYLNHLYQKKFFNKNDILSFISLTEDNCLQNIFSTIIFDCSNSFGNKKEYLVDFYLNCFISIFCSQNKLLELLQIVLSCYKLNIQITKDNLKWLFNIISLYEINVDYIDAYNYIVAKIFNLHIVEIKSKSLDWYYSKLDVQNEKIFISLLNEPKQYYPLQVNRLKFFLNNKNYSDFLKVYSEVLHNKAFISYSSHKNIYKLYLTTTTSNKKI